MQIGICVWWEGSNSSSTIARSKHTLSGLLTEKSWRRKSQKNSKRAKVMQNAGSPEEAQ